MFPGKYVLAAEEDTASKESIKKWIDEFWKTATPEEKVWFRIEFSRKFTGSSITL
jgi:ribonucleotide reductase beta subunit family protein with ferritin-like domain